ncbi:acyl-CoA dehydrogenase family protein [Natronomonas sp.]|uniref:acyl-CoA dehydrogenase family protein n=1 Tax=Natronomonas sp. TaxID=2184060 RepID=UPI0026086041|nr:acyl-CoA dehydrogenase family protein [Natronomonas sp.]
MPFHLTEDQRELREEVRAFANAEIEPRANDLDAEGTYPTEALAELGERRLTGLTIPEAYGGRGAGLVELAVAIEELSASLMAAASAVGLHLGVAEAIERFGSDEQRERFLPEMAAFETVGALGLSEADAGSDKLNMETTAERRGDGWVLNGHKQWVTNFFEADVVLTYAKTGPEERSPHNVSAFLVPTAAFDVETVWETLGANSVRSPRVSLSDARVPADRLLGPEGEGYVQRGELRTGLNVPARGVGIARAALEDAVAYTSAREQYDQSIGEFQGVGWTVGEMAERADSARLLTLRAAERADRGGDVTREFSMAKIAATQAAVDNANDAVQLHGGMGYTTEHDVERYLRDAKLLTIAGGPNEGHKDTLAEAVFERRGAPTAEDE